MPIEEDIGTRLKQLLDDSTDLSLGNKNDLAPAPRTFPIAWRALP